MSDDFARGISGFRHLFNDNVQPDNDDNATGESNDFLFPKRPAFNPDQLMNLIFDHHPSKKSKRKLCQCFDCFCHDYKDHDPYDLIKSFCDGYHECDPCDLLQSFCKGCHPPKRDCDPASLVRTGELIENGGFERGLLGWDISGNVQQMDQYDSHLAHQGFKAATLGLMNGCVGDGSISQVVRNICPQVRYQFTFFASPHVDNDNAEIQAVLDFLDRQGNVIINRGLYITVQRNALAEDKVWIAYINNIVAPEGGHSARITIAATDPNWNFDEHVHIDDVSLVAL